MALITDVPSALDRLRSARVIAVLGAHVAPDRPAHYVPSYLHEQGYRILPVNPHFVGTVLWGQPCVALVTDLREPIDLIDVFRASHMLDMHVPEILAMDPLPRTVWFQLGIRNDRAASALADAGIDVVQSRCTLADHQRHGLPRVSGG
jgi:hypothetical protein